MESDALDTILGDWIEGIAEELREMRREVQELILLMSEPA